MLNLWGQIMNRNQNSRRLTLRTVKADDAQALLSIYAPYVQDTAVSFEYDIPSLPEFQSRIRTISEEYPYLVCEIDGLPAGYAYAHRLFSRAAYQWDAELSIYLDPQFHSMGIGSRLYAALIALLKMQNICGLYALVTAPNEKSEHLHRKFGFSLVGTYHRVGYKLGSWHDVSLFERRLCGGLQPPDPFIPFCALPAQAAALLLSGDPSMY